VARWNVSMVVKGWAKRVPTALVARADEQESELPRVERPVATPVNLVPAASAVEATAGNKKHDDDDEKGSGVHGSLLAIKLSNYPRANEYEPYLSQPRVAQDYNARDVC
jgi:hypothetical protein